MSRIYTPSFGPGQWRILLKNPDKQWKRKYSALELAVSWERAQITQGCGIPREVAEVKARRIGIPNRGRKTLSNSEP